MIKRAILSVYDKTGIVEFARALVNAGVEIISTGGTYRALKEAGIPVVYVSDVTGFPEILDGRVKTLHPKIHGGILARRRLPSDLEDLRRIGAAGIDLVAVNLYPFEATIQKPGVTVEEALENIDIGGPCMVRAAAKNYPDVVVVVRPERYPMVAGRLLKGEAIDLETRRQLAAEAFAHTAAYDAAIVKWFGAGKEQGA